MPLWRVFHAPSAFTPELKKSFAAAVTELYTAPPVSLPAFYVNVVFIPLSEENIWIGGEPRRDFVRIAIEQIARSLPAVPAGPDGESEEGQKAKAYRKGWMDRVNETVKPFIADRGLEWENHIYETPFDLWRVNGLGAPPANSEAEALWRKENRAIPWDKSTANGQL